MFVVVVGPAGNQCRPLSRHAIESLPSNLFFLAGVCKYVLNLYLQVYGTSCFTSFISQVNIGLYILSFSTRMLECVIFRLEDIPL